MSVTLYHGTVAHNVESIKSKGLRPNPSEAFRMNRIPNPKDGAVYMTTEKDFAKQMAEYRSMYDETEPGEELPTGDWKRPDAPPKHVGLDETPVVLEFDIPEDITGQSDPDFIASTPEANIGRVFFTTIPGEYVTQVHEWHPLWRYED